LARLGLNIRGRVLLCFGGSQGSAFLNSVFKMFVSRSTLDFQIIHITGVKDFSSFSSFYDKINRKVCLFDFCHDMQLVYSCADVVIARSGALSLAEVSYYGIPAIFIPFPGAGQHQYRNALFAHSKGSCRLQHQEHFSFSDFKLIIEELLTNAFLRNELSSAMHTLALAVSEDTFFNSFHLSQ
jgi:UDP-N-acetylglucosamine--N-acetylmuramyl-(pentapeptide) pyrophosphoryl-undecaprenol N-acetylglucosamine transferase